MWSQKELGFEPRPASYFGANYLTSRSLGFLICKVRRNELSALSKDRHHERDKAPSSFAEQTAHSLASESGYRLQSHGHVLSMSTAVLIHRKFLTFSEPVPGFPWPNLVED